MAVLFPDDNKNRVIFYSQAEKIFYQKCRKLDKKWRVYYSCTLSEVEEKEGLKENETDFVLYHPFLGCIVVEVKGGKIRYDFQKQQYYSTNRFGEEYKIKNPFKQALIWKSRFVRFLAKKGLRAPITHSICLPNIMKKDLPDLTEVDQILLIGREELDTLESTFINMVRSCHPSKFLNFKDIASDMDRILAGENFSSKLYLKDYIDSHELRVKDYEMVHESLVNPIANSQCMGIEGEAGTGKTILATLIAKKFINTNKRVLFLSSNTLLNTALKHHLPKEVEILTYVEFADKHDVDLLRVPKGYKGERDDWIQIEAPDLLKNKIAESNQRYDVMICDEAQDVQPFWWEAFQEGLEPQEGRFYIFFDRNQGIFGSGHKHHKFVPEDIIPISPPYFPLIHNYRTTREIAAFSQHFRTSSANFPSHCGRLGYAPEIISYKSSEGARSKITALIRRLIRDEGLRTTDITLLSARIPNASNSTLRGVHELAYFPLIYLKADCEWPMPEGRIPVSTIHAFKGLESSVIIFFNINEYNLPLSNPIMSSLVYVACTRAKHMLYILTEEGSAKEKAFRKALAQLEQSGSMVIEGSEASFEFKGEVSFLDPERFGWIRVDDKAFQKNQIMFFPSDTADMTGEKLKVGDKVKFRPQFGGNITYAGMIKKLGNAS